MELLLQRVLRHPPCFWILGGTLKKCSNISKCSNNRINVQNRCTNFSKMFKICVQINFVCSKFLFISIFEQSDKLFKFKFAQQFSVHLVDLNINLLDNSVQIEQCTVLCAMYRKWCVQMLSNMFIQSVQMLSNNYVHLKCSNDFHSVQLMCSNR